MKFIMIVLMVLQSYPILAGYYAESRIDAYDPTTGLYYKAIEIEREQKGFMSKGPSTQIVNISVYNPDTDKQVMLFKENKQRIISGITFEKGINKGRVEFYGSDYSPHIKNNIAEQNRKPKNKILISVTNTDQKYTELWVADKNGENLKLITKVPSSHSWHIDVKRAKLRVVYSQKGKFSIESFDW